MCLPTMGNMGGKAVAEVEELRLSRGSGCKTCGRRKPKTSQLGSCTRDLNFSFAPL